MLNPYDPTLYGSERDSDQSQSAHGYATHQSVPSVHTQSPGAEHVSSSRNNRNKDIHNARSLKSSLVILDDSTDEEYEEMMSYTFTCTKVNHDIKDVQSQALKIHLHPTANTASNILKESSVSNQMVKTHVDEAPTHTATKNDDVAHPVAKKEHTKQSKEQKRKNPESPRENKLKETKLLETIVPSDIVNKPTKTHTSVMDTLDPTSNPVAKKKKLTFQDQVLQHLLVSMKPFNLKTLAADLKTTDVALHNLMLSLVDKNIVIRKEFTSSSADKNGEKQKRYKELYWVDVDRATQALYGPSGAKIYSDSDKKQAIAERERLLKQEVDTRKELCDISNAPSIQDVRKKVDEEEQVVEKLRQRYQDIKKHSSGKASIKTCPKLMEKKIIKFKTEWKKRKQQCLDFVENLADAMEKKKKDVIKDLQLELDAGM